MDYKEAVELQKSLAERVIRQPLKPLESVLTVAAADVSYHKSSQRGYAAIVVATYPEQQILETATAALEVDFPYIPGLLSFREMPLVYIAWSKLLTKPDLLICDGQGIAHPRRIGLASHVGLEIGVPTVGCAKSRLIGIHEDPGGRKGSSTPLIDTNGEIIGKVLRTRDRTKPLYVSIGHGVSLPQCEEIVLNLCTRYRLPDIARAAHNAVTELRRSNGRA